MFDVFTAAVVMLKRAVWCVGAHLPHDVVSFVIIIIIIIIIKRHIGA
jgi:p-aminobenzoyl-glutamate transporter AbgT